MSNLKRRMPALSADDVAQRFKGIRCKLVNDLESGKIGGSLRALIGELAKLEDCDEQQAIKLAIAMFRGKGG